MQQGPKVRGFEPQGRKRCQSWSCQPPDYTTFSAHVYLEECDYVFEQTIATMEFTLPGRFGWQHALPPVNKLVVCSLNSERLPPQQYHYFSQIELAPVLREHISTLCMHAHGSALNNVCVGSLFARLLVLRDNVRNFSAPCEAIFSSMRVQYFFAFVESPNTLCPVSFSSFLFIRDTSSRSSLTPLSTYN